MQILRTKRKLNNVCVACGGKLDREGAYCIACNDKYNKWKHARRIKHIRDIHYVSYEKRTTWDFCKLLDTKYLNSAKRTFEDWFKEAKKYKWVKL